MASCPSFPRASGFRPRKRFGQHFLHPAWTRRLLDLVAPSRSDWFVEIGPGRGELTLPLASRVRAVVAVEIDRDLAADLKRRVPDNVTVINADYLQVDLARYVGAGPARVAGNLPYNAASPMLLKLVRDADEGRVLTDAHVLLQREVADRVTARPGSRRYGVLSVLVQLGADAERLLTIPPGAFRPIPKVTSVAVRLRFRPRPVAVDEQALTRVVGMLFQQRRKMLVNAIKPLCASRFRVSEVLARAGLEGVRRPETLTLEEIARLTHVFGDGPVRAVL